MSDESQTKGPIPVGYQQPPRHTQFKKGQSGNPAGRPKGTPNLATTLEKALSAQVVVTEGGQRRTVSKLEAAVTQLVNKAALGDPRATQQVLSVLHVLDGDAGEPRAARLQLTDADQQVKTHIVQRIRRTTPQNGEGHDDAQH